MKKTIIIAVCALLVLTIVGISVFYVTKPSLSIEDVLPKDPLIYLKVSDIQGAAVKVITSDLFKSVMNIDYDMLLDKEVITKEQKSTFDSIREKSAILSENIILARLLGKEVAIALYPGKLDIKFDGNVNPDDIMRIIENFVSNISIAVHLQPEIKFLEFISKFSLNKDVSQFEQEVLNYKEKEIRIITIPDSGLEVGYVEIGDLLIVGLGDKSAKAAVDVFRGDKGSLDKDSNIIEARKNYVESATLISLLNIEGLISLVENKSQEFPKTTQEVQGQQDKTSQLLDSYSGFRFVTISSRWGDISEFKFNAHIDRDKFNNVPFMRACDSSVNGTIDFIPTETIVYYWDNCLEIDYYWQEVKRELLKLSKEDASNPMDQIKDFENKMGLSIEEDIIGAFASEMGGALFDIKLSNMFPTPEFIFFIKVKNKAKVENLMNKLLDKPFFMIKDESYSDINIKYINSPIASVQPSYCYIGDYMLISINRDLLKNSINVSAGGVASLLENKSFKEIDPSIAEDSTSISFGKIDKISEKLEGIINFSNLWLVAKDNELKAFKSGTEKRLEDVDKTIALMSKEVGEFQKQIDLTEDKIWDLQAEQKDISAEKTNENNAIEALNKKQGDIEASIEKREELKETLLMYELSAKESEKRKIMLDEIVFPILRSFLSIDSFGMRKTSIGDVFETNIFLKEKVSTSTP
ncbi:MAG: hypothetical protein P9X22_07520 [Candidatus Zapsychrus exili]|nr:hypothetical protein [Candidatus Zapsychrus exili]